MSKNNVPNDISEIQKTTAYMQKSCFWVSFVLLHLYDGIYNKRKFHIPLVYCWNLLMYLLQNYWAIQRRLGES